MDSWKTMVQLNPRGIRLLMTDPERNELLKAVLPAFPQHPRALLGCLEDPKIQGKGARRTTHDRAGTCPARSFARLDEAVS